MKKFLILLTLSLLAPLAALPLLASCDTGPATSPWPHYDDSPRDLSGEDFPTACWLEEGIVPCSWYIHDAGTDGNQ